jgi:fatty-acyl-CoA synthase
MTRESEKPIVGFYGGAMRQVPADRRAQLELAHPEWRAMTISAAFDRAAHNYAERALVITEQRTYSYREMLSWSKRLASGLIASGVARGDKVAMVMGNYPEYVAIKLAISGAGATAVPVNYLLRRDELRYILQQSETKTLITMSRFRDLDYLAELTAIAPGWEAHGGGVDLPLLRWIFVFPTSPLPDPRARTLVDLEAMGNAESDRELTRRASEQREQACCDIIYTSGTTGRPKGVMLTHDMVLRTAYASAYTRAFEDARRIMFALPMYHVFGYIECFIACTFVGGAIIPQIAFDPERMLDAAERFRATEIVCLPMMTLKMLEVIRRRGFHREHLLAFFNSGGTSPSTIWGDIRAHFGATEVLTAYGMTETTASTCCTLPEGPDDKLAATNGRLKAAGVAGDPRLGGVLAVYKTVDPQTGCDLPVGSQGELMVRGPIVTAGYYNKPLETQEALDHGWLHTGDIGVVDAEGYVTLLGRIKESYRCGGELVIPTEVEEIIARHPLVKQVLVVGVPDEKMGEVGCACVVPDENERPHVQELIELCAVGLARFKVPKHVIFMTAEDVPVTATGRAQKFKLTEIAKQRIGLQANAITAERG